MKKEDIKDEGGRCPLKVDATVSELLLNRQLVHLNTCPSQDHTDDKLVVSPATPATIQDTVTQGFFNIEMPRLRAVMKNLHVSWMSGYTVDVDDTRRKSRLAGLHSEGLERCSSPSVQNSGHFGNEHMST